MFLDEETEIVPTANYVLVEPIEPEKVTKGGIILPDAAQERDAAANVIAVGPKATEVTPGDRVLFSRYSGHDIKCNGKEYKMITQDDIIAILKAKIF